MKSVRRTLLSLVVIVGVVASVQGCQTLREIAALRSVNFALDRVTNATLAGIDIQRLRSYEDLRATDVVRIGASVADRRLPLRFQLHVAAQNPAENSVQARLVRMNWTLLIEDRETVSGVLDQAFILPPGETTDIPLGIEVDLLDFFDRSARDLVELALAVAGQGEPQNVKVRALPTIDTPVGAIDYPNPITIVNRDLGGEAASTRP